MQQTSPHKPWLPPLRVRVAVACVVALSVGALTRTARLPGEPPAAPNPLPTRVRLASGMSGFNPFGDALAQAYRRVLRGYRIDVHDSAGSIRTVQALHRGEADFGPAFADVAYLAYIGRLEGTSTPLNRLRGLAVLQLAPLQVLVRRDAPIDDIAGLRGRRVAIGPPGSGTSLTSQIVLQAYGLTLDDVIPERLPFAEATKRLLEGRLDAVFLVAGSPARSMWRAAEQGGSLLNIDGPGAERLRSEYPFLRFTFIPGGTYPGHPAATRTIGVDHVLLCRADLSDTIAYDLTRSLFLVLPALSAQNIALRLIDADQAPATPVPLHRGAARYYRERELMR